LDTRWIQPIIMGYLNECHFEVDQQPDVQLILISRRNRYRAGVRMHCRGIDDDGNVANYVETEQVNNRKKEELKLRNKIFSSDFIGWNSYNVICYDSRINTYLLVTTGYSIPTSTENRSR
jgi:hypothetical protein